MTPEARPDPDAPLALIRALQPQLPPAERRLAAYVLAHEDVIYRSITELVTASGVGYGTIIRFCRRLGSDGFQDFKVDLARDLARQPRSARREDGGSALERAARRAQEAIARMARTVSPDALEDAARRIARARRLVVAGVAASGVTARELVYRMARIGLDAVAESDGHMQRVRAATLGAGDVLVVVSFSGATRDVLDAAGVARARGAGTVALTNFVVSPLTGAVDCALAMGLEEEPLASEIVGKAAIDTLVDALMTRVAERTRDAATTLRRTSKAASDTQV